MSTFHCQIWMGSLEPFMTETFILNAFKQMGENALSVKVMRNKLTGEAAGYCFVHFGNDEEAMAAMHKLNGKPIPGTNPPVRFRLNNASNTGRNLVDRDLSVWVGDLSSDVDDFNLYRVFSSKYNTIKTAKIILDSSGFSKGYGFVRFGSEEEMRDSLTTMNGYIGLGTKPIKISNAVPKPKGTSTTSSVPTPSTPTNVAPLTTPTTSSDYSQYYDTYWQNYAQWTPQQSYYEHGDYASVVDSTANNSNSTTNNSNNNNNVSRHEEADDLELINHSVPCDIDKINRERIEQDCIMWDALESSKWFPPDALEIY